MPSSNKNQTPVTGENWGVYHRWISESSVSIISFDADLAEEEQHKNLNDCCRVQIKIPKDYLGGNDLPDRAGGQKLYELEESLCAAMESSAVDCRLAGMMTHSSIKEFVFQADNAKTFEETFDKWRNEQSWQCDLKTQKGWEFFDSEVAPDRVHWQQIMDSSVINQLIQAGSDPEKIHSLEHVFVGAVEALHELQEVLAENKFQLVSLEDDTLVMSRDSILDLDEVWSVTSQLLELAESYGLEYDGWGCLVAA